MSQPQSWSDAVTFRCGLVVDGVPVSAYRQADAALLAAHPELRERIERDLRHAVAREIVDKVAPEVAQVRPDGSQHEQRLTREEAVRLARIHAQELAKLASRLEEAGENYALQAAWKARDAAQGLTETLDSDDGRLPTDPRFWSARRH